MAGKIDIYNLGELGVDVVKSPLHQSDGDLIQAQNAMPDPSGLEGGIRKRDGMTKLNAIALTGTIEGAYSVPLPMPGGRRYYVGIGNLEWYVSIGGVTGWAGGVTTPTPVTGRNNLISFRGRMFYGRETASSAAMVRVWDGVTDNVLARMPPTPDPAGPVVTDHIGAMWIHRGELYAFTWSNASSYGQVYKVDLVTGAVVRVGATESSSEGFYREVGLVYLDSSWILGAHDIAAVSTPSVRTIKKAGEAFSVDHVQAAPHLRFDGGAVYRGDLYVGTATINANNPIIEKRDVETEAWTTSDTAVGSAGVGVNSFRCFAVFDDKLFCVQHSSGGNVLKIRMFNGTVWATDHDMILAGRLYGEPGSILAENDALYVTFRDTGYVMRRDLAGVWTLVTTTLLTSGTSLIGFIP